MNKPTFFKFCKDREEALEILSYLYEDFADMEISSDYIRGYYNNGDLAFNWTKLYGNIMISMDFVDYVHKEKNF